MKLLTLMIGVEIWNIVWTELQDNIGFSSRL